jgi:hypothetical protein
LSDTGCSEPHSNFFNGMIYLNQSNVRPLLALTERHLNLGHEPRNPLDQIVVVPLRGFAPRPAPDREPGSEVGTLVEFVEFIEPSNVNALGRNATENAFNSGKWHIPEVQPEGGAPSGPELNLHHLESLRPTTTVHPKRVDHDEFTVHRPNLSRGQGDILKPLPHEFRQQPRADGVDEPTSPLPSQLSSCNHQRMPCWFQAPCRPLGLQDTLSCQRMDNSKSQLDRNGQ